MIVDYRKRRTEHTPILIDGVVVEHVESFKFLGVHITNKLTRSKHTKTVVKRARKNVFSLRRLKKCGMVPRTKHTSRQERHHNTTSREA